MAGEWTTASLGELCEFRSGSAFKPVFQGQSSGRYPFVKVSDMNLAANAVRIQDARNWVSEDDLRGLRARPLPPGSVVFAKIGEALRQNRLRQVVRATVVDNNIMGAAPNSDRIDPLFFYYALSRFDFSTIAQGTALPYLTVSALSKLTIDVPPVSEQRAIAHILGALDDKIESNRRMSDTLEAMARALFRSWFVDFDPVRAKVEGRDPGLPRSLADLFPDRLVDSELGEVPTGWYWTSLHGLLEELETGGRPKGGVSGYLEGVPSIGAESIVGLGVFDYSKTRYVPHDFFRALTKGRAKNRDVLLYKDGGRPGEFEPHVAMFGDGFPFAEFAINEHVYRVRAVPELGQNWLFFWLSSGTVMEEMRIKGTGVAIPGLNSTQVKSLTALVPTEGVARAFDAFVEPIVARVLSNSKTGQMLDSIRDTLLPKLISGGLRVPRPDRMLAAAPA